jgi:hypothetical protein
MRHGRSMCVWGGAHRARRRTKKKTSSLEREAPSWDTGMLDVDDAILPVVRAFLDLLKILNKLRFAASRHVSL